MKTLLLSVAGLGLLAAVAVQVLARTTPRDTAAIHVEPKMPEPGAGRWPTQRGFRAAAILDGDPASALARFDRVALDTARTERVMGTVEEGRITYLSRTAFWGFPDATSVAVETTPEGPLVTIYGRALVGGYDWGVNRRRIERWLAEIPAAG